jgi:hypothetical protein
MMAARSRGQAALRRLHPGASARTKRSNGCARTAIDDLIKNNVICSFGRGEDEKAAEFAQAARERGLSPEQKQDVHAQTLKAWVRERVEGGDSFPMDLFGAFVGQRATIKKGK